MTRFAFGIVFVAVIVACQGSAAPLAPGARLRDCGDCPSMVVIPAGQFLMGSPATESGRFEDEGPQHAVTIARPFAVTRFPITRREYEQFVGETHRQGTDGCSSMSNDGEWVRMEALSWRDPGSAQTADHPVVCVSWDDAVAYSEWLSARSGHRYRLLSEAEFEYVARAGATTAFPWGDSAGTLCAHANSFDVAGRRAHPDWPGADCDDGYATTAPVDAFPPNGFGLYGTTGNVFQWTADCFVEGGYASAPTDGTPRTAEPCVARVIRGGSWLNGWRGLRAAMRDRDRPQDRYTNIGIRLAREL